MFRRRNSIVGSLFAMLAGFVLIALVSPLLAWQSQQQDRAKNFQKAEIVSAEEVVSGYIAIEGEVIVDEPLGCPKPGDVLLEEGSDDMPRERCTFVEQTTEEYKFVEKEVCGELSDDQVLIEHVEDDCFLVEELEWTAIGTDAKYASFDLGAYRVTTTPEAIYVDERTFVDYSQAGAEENPEEGDLRATFNYQLLQDRMLVAGDPQTDGLLTRALDGRPFVISARDFNGTLDDLKQRDRSASTGLAVGSAFMMMLGFILVLSPLMAITNIFHAVPFIGGHVGRGIDAVIVIFGGLLGLLIWGIMFTVIVIVNNLLVAIILMAILGGIALYYFKTAKKTTKPEKKKE